jgi:hypothetical protein
MTTAKDTLIIIQCCKSKNPVELYPDHKYNFYKQIPKTKSILENAVKQFTEDDVIDVKSKLVTALSLYTGHFYSVEGLKDKIVEELLNGRYDFLIMSAGYGFVHPFQRIHDYDQQMKGKVTTYWLNQGLPQVLSEYVENVGFQYVYGFFSKSADYRRIFEKVDWENNLSLREAGFFYVEGIKGAGNILRFQAELMLKQIEEGFANKSQT